MTTLIFSRAFLTIGLLLIIAWGIKQLPPAARTLIFNQLTKLKPYAVKLLKWLIVIAVILAIINWLGKIINRDTNKQTKNTPPFARVNGCVKKINSREVIVTINGSEKEGMDTGLTVKSGQIFEVHQILFDNPKENRITYNFNGDFYPIWGGRSWGPAQIVKYGIDGSVNAVVVVLKNCQSELPITFNLGQTSLTAQNPLCQSAKIFLYYNGVREQRENGGKWQKDFQAGWDGSTATFRIIIRK